MNLFAVLPCCTNYRQVTTVDIHIQNVHISKWPLLIIHSILPLAEGRGLEIREFANNVFEARICFRTTVPRKGHRTVFLSFYPTVLKGCRGIVFTMVSGWAGGRPVGRAAGKSLSGLYLRNRKV